MPNYSQYSPWTDAAAYGAGLGNSLSQGLLQLPQERFALAQQQAQMMLRSQLAQQSLNQRAQYNEGRLDNQRQGLDQRAANADVMQKLQELGLQLKMQQAGQPRVEGGFLIPGLGGGQGMGNTNQVGGQPPNQPQNTQPQATGGLPGGIMQLPRQALAQPPINQNDELASKLKALSLFGQFSSTPGLGTNNAAQWGQNQASNMVVNPYGQQGMPMQPPQGGQQMPQGQGMFPMQQQPPQGLQQNPMQQGQGSMDTNAILQQAQQAIQQGADPMKVRQRLQSMGLSQ